MIFANSWVLLLIILVPFLVWAYLIFSKSTDLQLSLAQKKVTYSDARDAFLYHLPFILRIIIIIVILVALARPQFGQSFTTNKNKGLDIVFAVDTSQSMSALDFSLEGVQTDRLTVLKSILKSFIEQRASDRLGLIVFADEAYTQSPITADHGALLGLVDKLYIGMVGKSTAIGSAIGLGVKRLKDLEAKAKIIILMTDGQNTSGKISPSVATELAKKYKIKIYTIGIGRDGAVPFKLNTPFGEKVINQVVNIDESSLIEIAEATGARYYRAESSAQLAQIYQEINTLEKTEVKFKEYSMFKDIFEYFLWVILVLVCLEVIVSNTILKRL